MAKSKWEDISKRLAYIQGMAMGGLSDEQMAKNLGISASTYYEYQKKYSEFSEAIKKGKEVADYEVENALYKRAIGYYYYEEEYDSSGSAKTKKKHLPADIGAIICWLSNRQPDKWKRNRDGNTNISDANDTGVVILSEVEDNAEK